VRDISLDPRMLFTGNYIGSPSATIYRRNNMEFDNKLKWLVDLEYYIRMLQANKKFAYTTKPLVSIGIGDMQVTNECIADKDLNVSEYSYVYKKLGMHTNKRCKSHLLNILSSHNVPFSEAEKNGITHLEYFAYKIKAGFFKLARFFCGRQKNA
jgi:hypothetical protein